VSRREALTGTVEPQHLFDKGGPDPEVFCYFFYRPFPDLIGVDDQAAKI
jgi:hypothetical protein